MPPRPVARHRVHPAARPPAVRLVLGLLGFLLALAGVGASVPVSAITGSQRAAAEGGSFTPPFRAATFNLLGASHTGPNGSRTRFDGYAVRMDRAIALMARRDFGVVGLQEFQRPQYLRWSAAVGDSWAAYPGLKLGLQAVQNSIIWRTDRFELLEAHTVEIPYFKGRLIEVPYVKLRDRSSGRDFWVLNTHNPSDSFGPAQRWRNQALMTQAALLTQLQFDGTPVVFLGDLNDRERAFCRLTRFTNLEAANGGGWLDGRCAPPQRMPVDWIFLSRFLNADNYTLLDNRAVDRITDHFVIIADLAFPVRRSG
jgi:endonuclease/exonuclease/phosphatase family metal-dependent hydrolase